MGVVHSTGERLRRATQLWHAYLASTGQRFELVQFLKDRALEQQVIDASLASGDSKLIGLAMEWLRDSGRPAPAASSAPSATSATSAPSAPAAEGAKPSRYLRGVR